MLTPPTVSCSQELLASRGLVSTPVPNCLNRRAPVSLLRPHWEQVEGSSYDHYNSKKGGACQTDMQGNVPRKELDLPPFSSQLFAEEPEEQAEEQAKGPGRLLYRDGFSTILHLLLGSPRPAARTLHAELCQAGARQGLSLCESSPAGPVRAVGVSAAQGWWPAWGDQDILRARPEYSQGGRGQYFGFETVRRAGDLFLFSGLSFPLQVSSRTSPSTTRSTGSSSAPTCAPPRHHPPPPQAAPPLWPTGLCRPPSRRATEHLDPPPRQLAPAHRLRAAPGATPGPQAHLCPA